MPPVLGCFVGCLVGDSAGFGFFVAPLDGFGSGAGVVAGSEGVGVGVSLGSGDDGGVVLGEVSGSG